jgi:nascent polypeptide-associated complex subunit alpha
MPEIKEQHVDEVDSDSDIPDLEDGKNVSKTEAKARKAMAKLGLKSVPEINRVVIRRSNNVIVCLKKELFVIAKPDVYKTVTGETHIVFGDAKVEDVASQQALTQQYFSGPKTQDDPTPSAAADDEDEEDEEGIEPNDIEMVMTQANVSRAKAVRALKVS